MNAGLLGVLSLLWTALKSVVANETINHAMDNWTKGTSNTFDDAVWALLERVTGVADAETKKKMLEDGLEAIEEQYQVAKLEGRLAEMKIPTKRWQRPSMDEIRSLMTGESSEVGTG